MPTRHLYILRCSDGSLYTGYTSDLDARIAAHNAGRGAKYAASRRPVRPVHIVYPEPADSKAAAMRRKLQIKRWTKAKIEALIAGNCRALEKRSKRRTPSWR